MIFKNLANLKKHFFLNIIALLGYINFIGNLFLAAVTYYYWEYEPFDRDILISKTDVLAMLLTFFNIITVASALALFILSAIEYKLRNRNNPQAANKQLIAESSQKENRFHKIHSIFFNFGMVLAVFNIVYPLAITIVIALLMLVPYAIGFLLGNQ